MISKKMKKKILNEDLDRINEIFDSVLLFEATRTGKLAQILSDILDRKIISSISVTLPNGSIKQFTKLEVKNIFYKFLTDTNLSKIEKQNVSMLWKTTEGKNILTSLQSEVRTMNNPAATLWVNKRIKSLTTSIAPPKPQRPGGGSINVFTNRLVQELKRVLNNDLKLNVKLVEGNSETLTKNQIIKLIQDFYDDILPIDQEKKLAFVLNNPKVSKPLMEIIDNLEKTFPRKGRKTDLMSIKNSSNFYEKLRANLTGVIGEIVRNTKLSKRDRFLLTEDLPWRKTRYRAYQLLENAPKALQKKYDTLLEELSSTVQQGLSSIRTTGSEGAGQISPTHFKKITSIISSLRRSKRDHMQQIYNILEEELSKTGVTSEGRKAFLDNLKKYDIDNLKKDEYPSWTKDFFSDHYIHNLKVVDDKQKILLFKTLINYIKRMYGTIPSLFLGSIRNGDELFKEFIGKYGWKKGIAWFLFCQNIVLKVVWPGFLWTLWVCKEFLKSLGLTGGLGEFWEKELWNELVNLILEESKVLDQGTVDLIKRTTGYEVKQGLLSYTISFLFPFDPKISDLYEMLNYFLGGRFSQEVTKPIYERMVGKFESIVKKIAKWFDEAKRTYGNTRDQVGRELDSALTQSGVRDALRRDSVLTPLDSSRLRPVVSPDTLRNQQVQGLF